MTTSWTDPKTGATVRVGDHWKNNIGGKYATIVEVRELIFPNHPQCYADIVLVNRKVANRTRSRVSNLIKRYTLFRRSEERGLSADPNALKPCPFCGGTELHFDNLNSVTCEKCGGTGGWGDQDAPDDEQKTEGRRLWNQRATEAKAGGAI